MQNNTFFRLLIILLFIFSGLLFGILVGPSLDGIDIQIILGIGVFLIVAAGYSAIRIYILRQRNILKTSEALKEKSEVGFVVDTFHELVGELKEKEKELEKLRMFAEERAVRMEAYNENILQSVPSGVVSIDNSKKVKSINQAAESILGIKAKEVIDTDINEIFDEPLITIMKTNKTISRGEYPYVIKDNRHIWLGVTTSQLKNAVDETIGQISVFTDLTDIKALQAQVELKQRLSQLGEMSAGIAHELRNSMSVISGYAKLLSKKVETSNRTAVDAISAEIKSMDRIISELLSFAKPTVLNMLDVDLESIARETVTAVVGDSETITVSIKTEGPVFFKADEVLLRQALTNLFINAVEAMPGGGSLEIEVAHLQGKAEINIKDTGQGIPDNIRQKMFLPFYTTKPKGIGLGLALVQKIIVSHGGSIEVDSREGQGTTFRIIMPGRIITRF